MFANIKQINHYYPFGLNMEGKWNGANGNNKEWNDDFGLAWNDYGACFYDSHLHLEASYEGKKVDTEHLLLSKLGEI